MEKLSLVKKKEGHHSIHYIILLASADYFQVPEST